MIDCPKCGGMMADDPIGGKWCQTCGHVLDPIAALKREFPQAVAERIAGRELEYTEGDCGYEPDDPKHPYWWRGGLR